MAATKQQRTVRNAASGRARAPRRAPRAVRVSRKGKPEGRWIHHDDAAALWRGLCTSCKASLQRVSQNVARLVRDAGATLERLRDRAALTSSPETEAIRAAANTSTGKRRSAGRKQSQGGTSAASTRKSTKKAATTKRATARKTRASGSSNASRTKGKSARTTARTSRRAAKPRGAASRAKKSRGR